MTEWITNQAQAFDPLQWALLAVIFMGAAIVKGFLGIGLPAAAMAFLTLIMPPTEAVSSWASRASGQRQVVARPSAS